MFEKNPNLMKTKLLVSKNPNRPLLSKKLKGLTSYFTCRLMNTDRIQNIPGSEEQTIYCSQPEE